jgi:hypothetical protein
MKTNYPLQWPLGWERTHNPSWSKFKPSSAYSEAYDVSYELKKLGATDVVITSNMQYRNDGFPYARQTLSDTGVAVYFKLNSEEQCIPCDKWVKVEENLRAVAKTVEALRGLERWGAKDMVNAAFRGFKALPASAITTPYGTKLWHEVLEVSPNASQDVIEAAYRRLARTRHPDIGGSEQEFIELNAAYKEGTA